MAILTRYKIGRPLQVGEWFVSASAGGDSFPNDGKRTFFVAWQDGIGTNTITVVSQVTRLGLAVADLQFTASIANVWNFVGPFPADIFNDANGRVQLQYSGVTNLVVGAFLL